MPEQNKDMVHHMVEAINAGTEDTAIDELFAPRAGRRVKRLFAQFRAAFPDWREEVVELVAEGKHRRGSLPMFEDAPGRVPREPSYRQAHGGGRSVLLAGGGWQVRGLLGAGGQPREDVAARTHPDTEALKARDHANFGELLF